tara:strand:+ start:43 stop:288 length:246 start_codon:yes stop_codon:yes gene_type:complete
MREEINEAQVEESNGRQEQMMRNESKILTAKEGLRAAYWHLLYAYRDSGKKVDEPIMKHYKKLVMEIDSEIENIKKMLEVI